MPAAIQIADLSYSYPAYGPAYPPTPALHHIDLTIDSGQFVALMGAVGAGKSTLCLALNGLIPTERGGDFSGQVHVHGLDTRRHPVAEIATAVGLVFQDAEVQLFNPTVEDEIAFGLEGLGWPAPAIESRIDWALDAVGLAGFRGRSPRSLSGGEAKRLAIATVLAVSPPVLVLDEPTEGLDPLGREEVMEIVRRLADEGSTVIMATQDPEIAAGHADRLILMHAGRIVLDATPREVFLRLADEPARCVGIPQLARAAAGLRRRTGQHFEFLTLDEAWMALAGGESVPR